jgi:hypothetical protein
VRLKNTSRYLTEEVRALVEFGMRGVSTARLAVNVKNNRRGAYRGRAYDGVASCSPTARMSTVDRLVTIGIGAPEKFPTNNLVTVAKITLVEHIDRFEGLYPTALVNVPHPGMVTLTRQQPYGGRRAPQIDMADWREALVMVAAHEARHIWQYQHGKPRSEVDCERFAAKRLTEWRAQQ